LSYGKVQHLVDIDENIFAAFVIDSDERISELYVAPDSDLDKSKIEKIRLALDIKYYSNSKENAKSLLGEHKWDVMEYDRLKFVKIYPDGNLEHKMVVVIAACTKDLIDVVDSVIGYMNESEMEEQLPVNLFD
jgi:hypothetical protein